MEPKGCFPSSPESVSLSDLQPCWVGRVTRTCEHAGDAPAGDPGDRSDGCAACRSGENLENPGWTIIREEPWEGPSLNPSLVCS